MKRILTTLTLAATMRFVSLGQDRQTSIDRSAADHLDNRFGAGIMAGEPTGLSLKYWLNESLAVDGGIGPSFHHNTGLQLHSDVLWHKFGMIHQCAALSISQRGHGSGSNETRPPRKCSYLTSASPSQLQQPDCLAWQVELEHNSI